MRQIVKSIISGFVLSIFIICSASAQEYNLYIDDVDSCNNFNMDWGNLGNAFIKVNYVDITYDEAEEVITVETEITNERGSIANFYHLVLSNGGMPSEGEVAHLYFDATDINTPIVNIYAYNGRGDAICGNDGGSWYKANAYSGFDISPDNILSSTSVADYSADVLEASAYQVNNGGLITRTFRTKVAVSNVNAFDALMDWQKSYTYQGMQFADKVGVWFWAAKDAVSAYDNNFLDQFDTTICAVCDQTDIETKRPPVCSDQSVSVSVSSVNTVEPGQAVTVTFGVKDLDFEDLVQHPVIVSYDQIPAGAKPSVADGGQVALNANGEGSVEITWIPEIGDEGNHVFALTFAKDYGLGQLAEECPDVIVEVVPGTPQCKEDDDEPLSQADVELSQLSRMARKISIGYNKQRRKLGKKKTQIDNADPEAEFENGWFAYNKMINTKNRFYECAKTEFCEGGLQVVTLNSEIVIFNDSLQNLLDINNSRAKKFQREKRNVLQKIKGLRPALARRQAKRITNRRYRVGKVNSGYIPVHGSARSHVDDYIAAFGTERFLCPNANVVSE